MTDRELLELAAKAAGYFVMGWALPGCRRDGWVGAFLEREEDTGDFQKWNPLTDDGDALRLAVKLGICVGQDYETQTSSVRFLILKGNPARCTDYLSVPHCDDPYAATRRAIVRAAAEIGKEMK